MPHESRLTLELRALLDSLRVAALGTIGDDGNPFVSMPYAMVPSLGCLVIYVSGLATHTVKLQARTNVSLLVMQAGKCRVKTGSCLAPRHAGLPIELPVLDCLLHNTVSMKTIKAAKWWRLTTEPCRRPSVMNLLLWRKAVDVRSLYALVHADGSVVAAGHRFRFPQHFH